MFWSKFFEPKPFNSGFLPEENGHLVYYAEFGNPKGVPVIVFHGGPGGSFKAARAKIADLKKYRVIMFDQRGSGRSIPAGKIENNTTTDLLNDVDRLYNYLKLEQKVILWGGSWGSTLALLWAERNPDKVSGLLLSQIFLANKASREWEFVGNGNFYPDFVEYMEEKSKGKIRDYYNKLIQSVNTEDQLDAANHYGYYERVCGSLDPQFAQNKELSEKELNSQRIYMHYSVGDFFVKEDEIMKNIEKIKNIPALIIHNRLDFVCPVKAAWELSKKLINSRLIIVAERGHSGKKIYKTIRKEYARVLK